MELFVGVDWAEDHHDVVRDGRRGRVRAKGRVSNDLAGVARLHDLIASAVLAEVDDDEAPVVSGRDRDRSGSAGAGAGRWPAIGCWR